MAAVAKRSEGAFAVLVERHLPAIHAFNYRLTRNADDAADLAQETFLRVWSGAATWRSGRVRFTTWLHRIARNLCIDAHRRRRDATPMDFDAIESGEPKPESAPEQSAVRQALDAAIAALPERQRTALVLCHHQGMPNRDAAVVLNVSVDALESLLARARRTLRQQLRDYR